MRRWNGWGDSTIEYPLPERGRAFLETQLGRANPPQDVSLEEVVRRVPPSRLPINSLVNDEPVARVRHARGQSLPDWVALRSGRIPAFPDGVAYPSTSEHVQALLRYAARIGAALIPYGGGTSVVGHINPCPGDQPVLTVNLRRLNRLHDFDAISNLATMGAGVSGPELETHLRALGRTMGHFPQSFELSTLGGWIATRSSGQQSLGYGRIEDLFAGAELVTPAGSLVLPAFPASAAGPDLRQLVLGSEGRLGIITQATMRVSPLPEREQFHALFFPGFGEGMAAVRQLRQIGLPLSMLRLSTPMETTTTLALAGHERLLGLVERYLAIRGVAEEKAMLLLGLSGPAAIVNTSLKEARAVAGRHGGLYLGREFGKQWHKGRFQTPYLRNTLWELGYAVDTLETAVPWQRVADTIANLERALRSAHQEWGERIHVFTHLSHVYGDGASIYCTYIFRLAADPAETMGRWERLKAAASEVITAQGGTISHQHGVGTDHAPYLQAEKGELGMIMLADIMRRFDPRGIMNPGKLLPHSRAAGVALAARALGSE